jgi:hypothetical protein
MATLKNTIVNSTGYLRLPIGTTAQRPGSPVIGDFRYNTDRTVLEYYNGTGWAGIGVFEASGGTVTTAGGYRTHVFTSPGTLLVTSGSTANAEILLVAAGGSGGGSTAGGGGGGGILYNSGTGSVTTGSFAIGVGAGAPRTLHADASPNSGGQAGPAFVGGPSTFSSYTANGGGSGGGGGPSTDNAGTPGGSGGGGYGYARSGGSYTATQSPSGNLTGYGNNGGGPGDANGGSGGGGAGAAGSSAPSGGAGGSGLAFSTSGSSTFYSGGGGAGRASGTPPGGSGGGGAGTSGPGGANGGTNTGGGGGGGWLYQSGGGGSGGPGIVIIKYPYSS